jgi:hypothetical protein
MSTQELERGGCRPESPEDSSGEDATRFGVLVTGSRVAAANV